MRSKQKIKIVENNKVVDNVEVTVSKSNPNFGYLKLILAHKVRGENCPYKGFHIPTGLYFGYFPTVKDFNEGVTALESFFSKYGVDWSKDKIDIHSLETSKEKRPEFLDGLKDLLVRLRMC